MRDSTGAVLVGGLVTIGVGIIVVAGIFQLNKGGQGGQPGVASDATTLGTKSLSSLFS